MSDQELIQPWNMKNRHRDEPNIARFLNMFLADIESGRLKEGERLPSETELVRQFATSRPTVARALRDLQNLGLVERKVGSGTYVRRSAETDGIVALWAIDTRAWQHRDF